MRDESSYPGGLGGPEQTQTTPSDGDTDREREQGLDWPADPDELVEDTAQVETEQGETQDGATAKYGDR